ncbi:hypothetical protein [Streptomyces sp. NPDC018610]|uniref:hypothetical protein n=1 Tax=Streptomyces sp. NPDC018610 TaxID=3365049 RepID=UPI0037B75CCD
MAARDGLMHGACGQIAAETEIGSPDGQEGDVTLTESDLLDAGDGGLMELFGRSPAGDIPKGPLEGTGIVRWAACCCGAEDSPGRHTGKSPMSSAGRPPDNQRKAWQT